MARISIHIIHSVVFLVALQILNMGCFVQEFEPLVQSSVTPEINIINTLDEYIAEVVLEHKDAVPEAKEPSRKDIQIHKHAAIKLISISRSAISCNSLSISSLHLSVFSDTYNYQFWEDITPPPPKHTC